MTNKCTGGGMAWCVFVSHYTYGTNLVGSDGKFVHDLTRVLKQAVALCQIDGHPMSQFIPHCLEHVAVNPVLIYPVPMS